MRVYKTRHQFVMPLGRVPIGPILRQLAQHAKPARPLDQALNIGDRVVGGADTRRSGLDQPLDRVADIGWDDRESGNVAEIVGERLHAELHILPRLLARVGDVEETDDAPVFAVWRMAVGARSLLIEAPISGM